MKIMLFISLALGFTLIPGPNAMLIITTSLTHGTKRGLQVVAGISTAIAMQLAVAVFSTRWLVETLGSELAWIKWFGFTFIILLLLKAVWNHYKGRTPPATSGAVTFSRGLAVALTNPKAFIFFAAFLIPFVEPGIPYQEQVIILAVVFWLVVVFCDVNYAVFAAQLKKQMQHPRWKIYFGYWKANMPLIPRIVKPFKRELD